MAMLNNQRVNPEFVWRKPQKFPSWMDLDVLFLPIRKTTWGGPTHMLHVWHTHQPVLPSGKLTVGPWKSPIFSGLTHLPTPMTARVVMLIYWRVTVFKSWFWLKMLVHMEYKWSIWVECTWRRTVQDHMTKRSGCKGYKYIYIYRERDREIDR